MGLSSQVYSQSQIVADGLAIELLESLDLTYQIIPDYDDTENVVVGWDGDQFQYFVTFSKLPTGWLDADVWISGFTRDTNATSENNSLKVLDRGDYKSKDGYDIRFIEISYILKGDHESVYQLVHFITDHKNSYLAFATPSGESGKENLRKQVTSILKTSHLPASNITPLIRKNEDRYFGTWIGSYKDNMKRNVDVIFELKDDLTFSRKDVIDGEKDAVYTGVWSISRNTLSWTYLYGKPTTQERKHSETDTISSFNGDTLILMSENKKTEVVMKRVQ